MTIDPGIIIIVLLLVANMVAIGMAYGKITARIDSLFGIYKEVREENVTQREDIGALAERVSKVEGRLAVRK